MKLFIVSVHNQASVASPELLLSSTVPKGVFLPCLLDFDVLPESPMCHAREEHGKMQRDFVERKKGKFLYHG